MVTLRLSLLGLLLYPALCHPTKRQSSQFDSGSHHGDVDGRYIDEASGLAASRKFPGALYTHNDHGDGPKIYAIDGNDAALISTFTIGNANHTDWEDIAVGPCSSTPGSGSCIYICDAGYSYRNDHTANVIYKVKEPSQLVDQTLPVIGVLRFNWSAVETQVVMVDPSANLYIVSNVRGGRGMVIKLPNNAWDNSDPVWVSSNTYVNLSTYHHDPTGGDISPDGTEVILKGIHHVYYWPVTGGDVANSMTKPSKELNYHRYHGEGVGEAICWSFDGSGYYTLSEGGSGSLVDAPLYYYERLPLTPGAVGK